MFNNVLAAFKILFALLLLSASAHALISEQGDEALVRVLNIPNRYIGRDFCDKLKQHSEKNRVHLYEGLKSMTVLPPYLRKNVREFINLMDPWIENAVTLQTAELLYQLRAALDYDRFVTDEDIPSPDDMKIANPGGVPGNRFHISGFYTECGFQGP